MAQLEYSIDAINVLSRFYRCDILVYVEGDDDVPFWQAVFSELHNDTVAVEGVGGSPEADKYVRRITEDNARIVVARDADYLRVEDKLVAHDRVIYSYGYSLENSLYVPKIIERIAHICHRKIAPQEGSVSEWLEHLCSSLRPVVAYDVASDISGAGIACLGSNCEPFMRSRHSPLVDPAKVADRLKELGSKIPKKRLNEAEDAINNAGGYNSTILRGHLLASAVLRFVARHAARNVAYETLYVTAIAAFEREISLNHPHKQYYSEVVGRAVASVAELAA